MRHIQQAVYNKRPVIVAMGWDVPLEGYFMTVSPDEGDDPAPTNPDADPETGMIYSNLDDRDLPKTRQFVALTSDITYYKKVLLNMNIEVPPEFFGKVLAD